MNYGIYKLCYGLNDTHTTHWLDIDEILISAYFYYEKRSLPEEGGSLLRFQTQVILSTFIVPNLKVYLIVDSQ